MDEDNVIEKIRNSLEKHFEIKDCYFIVKKLERIYEDEIFDEEQVEDEDDDILDDDADEDPSVTGGSEEVDEDDYSDELDEDIEELPKEDVKVVKTVVAKKPLLVKRPIVKVKS